MTKTMRKPYENLTKTLRKPYENHTKTLRKPHENHTKIQRKPYENTTKTLRNQTENYGAVFNKSFLTYLQKDINFNQFPPLKGVFGEVNISKEHQVL